MIRNGGVDLASPRWPEIRALVVARLWRGSVLGPLSWRHGGRGAVASGTRPDRRRVRGRGPDSRPFAQPPGARALRRDVERALLVQVVPAAPAPAADRGPAGPGGSRRERRRDRRGRRHCRGVADREPQPSVGDRAVPGRGDGRRGHPARHLHHGGAPARRDGPPLLRAARRRPPALARRGRGGRDLVLRQLGRRAHRGRRAHLRPLLQPEPSRQRALHGRPAHGAPGPGHRVRPGKPRRAARFAHRSGRHRRRERPGLGRLRAATPRAEGATTPNGPASRSAIPSRRSG